MHLLLRSTGSRAAQLSYRGISGDSSCVTARMGGVPSARKRLAELIRGKVADALPPTLDTGALRTDLRELSLTTRIGAGLPAEAEHDARLAEVLQTGVAEPRRVAARAILQVAANSRTAWTWSWASIC